MRLLIRTVATFINIGIFAVAVATQFLLPTTSVYIFYGVLAWFIGSIFLFRLPVMNRPIGRGTRPSPAGPSAPLASSNALPPGTAQGGASTATLDFCPFCTAPIRPGTMTCPQCGRAIPAW
jgi:hypothetical protein